jgi:hypothetical protein
VGGGGESVKRVEKVCNLVEAFKMYTNVTVETMSLTRDDRMITFRVKMV